jgi:hypothetical protein
MGKLLENYIQNTEQKMGITLRWIFEKQVTMMEVDGTDSKSCPVFDISRLIFGVFNFQFLIPSMR